jgi:hypothetical protein
MRAGRALLEQIRMLRPVIVYVGGIIVAQSCAAHAVIITVVAIIARTIKINASLSGFGAIYSPPGNKPEVARGTLRAETEELCELLHTSLVVQKMHWACPRGRRPVGLTCLPRRK